MTEQAVALRAAGTVPVVGMTRDKVELLKRTICRGASDDELALFMHLAERAGLDPFSGQVYGVKRWDSAASRQVRTVQTGIAGLRLIADRTGSYAPGRASVFAYRDDGKLDAATAYVQKRTPDGTWHEVAGTAYWDEAVQLTKAGPPTAFWSRMPRTMLAKCAEAAALRRAFPVELSGVYIPDEVSEPEPAAASEPLVDRVRRRGAPPLAELEAPEAEPEPPEPGTDEPSRLDVLRDLIAAASSTEAKVCKRFGVQALEDLSGQQITQACEGFQKVLAG